MKVTDTIKERLRLRTQELGTVKAVADLAGVYPQTISRWMTGDVPIIQDKNVDGLARALGISVTELYGIGYPESQDLTDQERDEIDMAMEMLRKKSPKEQERILKMIDLLLESEE